MQFDFRRVTMMDLQLLESWQRTADVARWWGDDAPFEESDLGDSRIAMWIVSLKGRPFGYMQDYPVHAWEGHHFGYLPAGARGIDQYIGVPEMIGRGYGTAFIRQRLASLFAAGVPVVATDPHPDNSRAIAAYEKVGFEVVGPRQETEWGLILPMEAWPQR
jgi:aminoglycoside 6'-N-acetyltransferase